MVSASTVAFNALYAKSCLYAATCECTRISERWGHPYCYLPLSSPVGKISFILFLAVLFAELDRVQQAKRRRKDMVDHTYHEPVLSPEFHNDLQIAPNGLVYNNSM